jgi:RNA polymerase primary sigma factor
MLAALARHGRPVRVPLNRTADLARIVRAAEAFRQEQGREPHAAELADRLGLGTELVESLLALNRAELRLDGPAPGLRETGGEGAALERFAATGSGDTETEVMRRLLVEEVSRALRTLGPRDARVLRLYFGLDGGREHTLEEIGALIGITRERVRQLRDRALRRLREGSAGRALESFAA